MQIQQTTDTVLMISPDSFQFNPQTAATNAFQQQGGKEAQAAAAAMLEFQRMVELLRSNGIRVITLASRKDIPTPDAVFPNNWFSLHNENGHISLVLYPMHTVNRRAERQADALMSALRQHGITIDEIIDLTHYEHQDKALEGTGSVILDRENRLAYASLSPRTDETALNTFIKKIKYKAVTFHSVDIEGRAVYHTNVVMSIGKHFAVIAAASIRDPDERARVLRALRESNKDIIDISLEQMHNMAGNILELRSGKGEAVIVMSSTALNDFTQAQRERLSRYGRLLGVDIDTIERIGGGSARCMLAEVFY